MNYPGTILFGFVAAAIIGLIVYRDATSRQLTHPSIYSGLAAVTSGVGAALSYQYAGEIVFGVHRIAFGQNYITNPFEIPLVYLSLTLVAAALTVSIYRFSTSFTVPQRKAS